MVRAALPRKVRPLTNPQNNMAPFNTPRSAPDRNSSQLIAATVPMKTRLVRAVLQPRSAATL